MSLKNRVGVRTRRPDFFAMPGLERKCASPVTSKSGLAATAAARMGASSSCICGRYAKS